MKRCKLIIRILFSFWILSILTGCMTFHQSPHSPKKKSESIHSDDSTDKNVTLKKNPELQKIYETHEITVFPAEVGDKFVNLYILTRKKEYLPRGNRTFCVKFFYDYFIDIGYGEVLEEIKQTTGKNMVEKAIGYAEKTGKIQVLLSGYEAQKLANQGRDVGVLGEYYYDNAEKYYTVHYSVVQPSNVSYDEEGNVVPYYVTGLLTKRKNVNDRYGTGTFLAQAGIAVGLIDFRWAYNRKMDGIIQKDSNGKFRGGIIFIVFPEKEATLNIALNQYKMVKVGGGVYTPDGRESVSLQDFFISAYEVTCEQYEDYCVKTGATWPVKGTLLDRNLPVTFVDWYDAIDYCNWRSVQEGYRPCYTIIKDNPDSKIRKVMWEADADGYRLPTVLEWEYAAKGGAESKGFFYSGGNEIDEVAWYNENSNKQIHGVGQKLPNEIGLYDMTGNVWEWCWDSSQSDNQTTETPAAEAYRMRKGGSSYNSNTAHGPFAIESIHYLEPEERNSFTGFRIVRQERSQ
ncbi:MAG: formylglycine-generating enzyme family protein [Spirochaetales bacterium]|nr:formylglycine-generating enzyme family protein [Spirochaetales bacterium]